MTENALPIRNRLIIRIPPNATAQVAGGLWVGIAGSTVGNKAFVTAVDLVCPIHNEHPKIQSPRINENREWDADTSTCCVEFWNTVRKALIQIT